jgi:hypothetical protein
MQLPPQIAFYGCEKDEQVKFDFCYYQNKIAEKIEKYYSIGL